MAVGTTADFVLTRNDVIASALRKIKAWPEDGNPPAHKIRDAIRALNLVLREEDRKRTGLSKALWALDTKAITLAAARYIYDTDNGLPTGVQEIHAAMFRDTSGDDNQLHWITKEAYQAIPNKDDTGEPEKIYLEQKRLLADQRLFIWPAPSTISTASDTVIQSEVEYTCILKHTSATENKPGSGASWELYWQAGDISTGEADTWATATDYENGPLILLTFKRPLFDFDGQFDNPDFPLGWEDYLIYRLALRLAPEYDLAVDSRQMLKQDLAEIELNLFPSSRPDTSDIHNKTRFF